MNNDIPKDNRRFSWRGLEATIQRVATQKDPHLSFRGKWKKYVKTQDDLKIYAVDGDWVRANLSVIFGHGGHGFVHEFIPMSEVWVATHHFKGCGCRGVRKDLQMSWRCFKSTTLHEIREFQEMKKGKIYWSAHQTALRAERAAGFLLDPFTELYI